MAPAYRREHAGHLNLPQLKVMSAIETCRTASPSAVTSRLAQNVTISTSPITRVAIGTAQSAKALRRRTGCRRAWRTCCRSNTSTWSSRCQPQIADIAYQNKAAVYGLLFKASAQTLLTIAADPKHLGAKIGMTSVSAHMGVSDDPSSACPCHRAGWRGIVI